jgi:hypothetical protein
LNHWIREIRHELYEYEGRITKLRETAAIDIPQAVVTLDRVLQRIEAYTELRVETAAAARQMSNIESFAQPLDEAKAMESTPNMDT